MTQPFLQRISNTFWALSPKLLRKGWCSLNRSVYGCGGQMDATTVPAAQSRASPSKTPHRREEAALPAVTESTGFRWAILSQFYSQQSREGRREMEGFCSGILRDINGSSPQKSEKRTREKGVMFPGYFFPTLEYGCLTRCLPYDRGQWTEQM